VLKIVDENDQIKLRVVEKFKGSDDNASIDSCMSIYEGKLIF
jgi:hypothetical protein